MLAYIIQTNTICIVICLLIFFMMRRDTGAPESLQRNFLRILLATVLLSFSDIFATPLNGAQFPGARFLLFLVNDVFYLALCFMAYLWLLYVLRRLGKADLMNRKTKILMALPILIFTVLILLTGVTGFIFRIDKNNVYSRGPGVFLHWIVTWGYMLAATVITVKAYRREPSRVRRSELVPLLYFMIAPVVGAIVQMLFYGLSTIQVGITLSILIIYLDDSHALILTDPLTGLNNRRNLDLFLSDCFQRGAQPKITMLMADLNRFKQVNDSFGHVAGDKAMKAASAALKCACGRMNGRLFLCRYGGDEFVIVGRELSQADIMLMPVIIREEFEKAMQEHSLPTRIDIAIGIMTGICTNLPEADALLHRADEEMYRDKQRLKGA